MTKYIFLLLVNFSAFAQWEMIDLGTKSSFRSMDVLNKKVIWAGGSSNIVLRSINGGNNWNEFKVGQNPGLDFRGIKGLSKKIAIAVSAGLGQDGDAMIFRTEDGGKSWQKVFETNEKGAFLDGICFLDKSHGFVFGDALGNDPYLLETKNGGKEWKRVDPINLPKVKTGSASFAASNSGMVTNGTKIWYAFQSQLLISENSGQNWYLVDSGFPSGESNGIFGLHFLNDERGFILGGDYLTDKVEQVNMAMTLDGGERWQNGKIDPPGLKESAASYKNSIIVTGTSGTSISDNLGYSWKTIDLTPFHVVRCAGKNCFAIGAEGRFGKMEL
ncbi:oxidoreductase [Jiulongibacter sp. NS-SX5]|uniref:oxidoreductase n=1 Tax=Jiulongibacter sp. NS-SX5 TaxID=3463854 RepID=UPI004059CAF5